MCKSTNEKIHICTYTWGVWVTLFLDKCKFVAISICALEEQGGTAALEFAMWDDGNTVSKQISLIHVVSGEQDCATCSYTDSNFGLITYLEMTDPKRLNRTVFMISNDRITLFIFKDEVPDCSTGIRVHSCRGFIQYHRPGPTYKRNCHRQLPFHPPRQSLNQTVTFVGQFEILYHPVNSDTQPLWTQEWVRLSKCQQNVSALTHLSISFRISSSAMPFRRE